MLTFDPPELQETYTAAIKQICQHIDWPSEELLSETYDPSHEDFDPSQYDEVITPDFIITLEIPYCDGTFELSVKEFIDLIEELKSAELEDRLQCWSHGRFIMRIGVQFDETSSISRSILRAIWNAEDASFCEYSFERNGEEIHCSLQTRPILFGLMVVKDGDYDKYLPPLGADDLFLEVKYGDSISKEEVLNIAWAYLFELTATYGIDLVPTPRSQMFEEIDWDDDGSENTVERFRPLMIGKGMTELQQMYNNVVDSADVEVQILYITKIFEFISQTVVSKKGAEVIRSKLLSPQALTPTIEYIDELKQIIEEERIYRKDREAIKLTMSICCEISEISNIAPDYLVEFDEITPSAKQADKLKALEKLAISMVDTRNSIAHSKANYEPTGEECPIEQMDQLVKCCLVAAQQAIRWYYSQPEEMRLT